VFSNLLLLFFEGIILIVDTTLDYRVIKQHKFWCHSQSVSQSVWHCVMT